MRSPTRLTTSNVTLDEIAAHVHRFYPHAHTATAKLETGLLVKTRRRQQLADYAQLGDPNNPFVFVVLLGADGPGAYYVRL